MELVHRLWRGEVGLASTYWLYGVVLNGIVLGVIGGTVVGLTGVLVLVVVYVAFSLAVSVFMAVAIWRSAGNYTGAKLWAVLARVAVVIGVIGLAMQVVKLASG
jgi:hypothetical protein